MLTYVRLRGARGMFCVVETSLTRPVMIFKQDMSQFGFNSARVWNGGVLLTGPSNNMSTRIREVVDEQLTTFAADYYKTKP